MDKNSVTNTEVNENCKPFFKNFKKGEKVLFLSHFNNFLKWIPGIIVKNKSPLLYVVQFFNQTRICHQNKLKRSKLSIEYHEKNVVTNEINTNENSDHYKRKRSESLSPEQMAMRKSKRIRNPPERLSYD